MVDLLRRIELLDDAAVHHRDAVGERQRLDLVVGDVDHGRAELLVQLLELDAQLGAELGVEVGERLVEEEDVDVAHQRPADGDALALAAGQLGGRALQERLDLQELGGALDARGDLVACGTPRDLQAEGQVALRPSCADRAHRTGTPCRCRGPSAPPR